MDLQDLGHHGKKHTSQETANLDALTAAFGQSALSLPHRLAAFSRHVRRQDIARFLAKYELFKLTESVNGSIVECGVFTGAGLFAWLHFSSILEPYNHTRKIIGFDTFEGFPGVHEKDRKHGSSEHLHAGAFKASSDIKQEIEQLVGLHDQNRPLGHIAKVELVAGDAAKTISQYVNDHPHLLISLMYLDFDLYEPTKAALEALLPRVVKGGVVAFDELNCAEFPGETTALMESLPLEKVELRRFPFEPYVSYFIKG
jgi:hypothetical protein